MFFLNITFYDYIIKVICYYNKQLNNIHICINTIELERNFSLAL